MMVQGRTGVHGIGPGGGTTRRLYQYENGVPETCKETDFEKEGLQVCCVEWGRKGTPKWGDSGKVSPDGTVGMNFTTTGVVRGRGVGTEYRKYHYGRTTHKINTQHK